jgi:hypothetical protein
MHLSEKFESNARRRSRPGETNGAFSHIRLGQSVALPSGLFREAASGGTHFSINLV